MDNAVYTRSYTAPPWDRKEILRYAGIRGSVPEIEALLDECLDEVGDKLTYKVCYREFPLSWGGALLDLGFMKTASLSLAKNLSGCESIVLFAATVGTLLDRLIARYAVISQTKALLLGAIGAERTESLCDTFNREISLEKAARGYQTRPRFSPGYGDLPLTAQREIFAVLDCPRKIGVTLSESLLMSPSKSVTAIIGVTSK